jgi:hypothetical protein
VQTSSKGRKLRKCLPYVMSKKQLNKTVKKKVNFINSSQNEGLSPSGIALSFDGLSSISWHSVWFSSDGSFSFHFFFFFWISNFFDLSITEETWVVEMRIWCIKIVNVLLLHCKELTVESENQHFMNGAWGGHFLNNA